MRFEGVHRFEASVRRTRPTWT